MLSRLFALHCDRLGDDRIEPRMSFPAAMKFILELPEPLQSVIADSLRGLHSRHSWCKVGDGNVSQAGVASLRDTLSAMFARKGLPASFPAGHPTAKVRRGPPVTSPAVSLHDLFEHVWDSMAYHLDAHILATCSHLVVAGNEKYKSRNLRLSEGLCANVVRLRTDKLFQRRDSSSSSSTVRAHPHVVATGDVCKYLDCFPRNNEEWIAVASLLVELLPNGENRGLLVHSTIDDVVTEVGRGFRARVSDIDRLWHVPVFTGLV